jgi:hypothetical protein
MSILHLIRPPVQAFHAWRQARQARKNPPIRVCGTVLLWEQFSRATHPEDSSKMH